MNRGGKATRVGQLLPHVLGEFGLDETLRAAQAIEAWRRVVGDRLAGYGRAVSLRDGRLFVEAESPVWLQEIRFHQVRILKRLEAECGAGIVRELQLRLPSPSERRE
jgi:predicted nucleic acid-binding Zn ribbon protein